jgi:hypothetical protein
VERWGPCHCGGEYVDQPTTIGVHVEDAEIALPDVPRVVCPQCDRSALPSDTLVRIMTLGTGRSIVLTT